jgi:hypothetical protein
VILAQISHLVNPASLGFFQEGQTVGFSPIDLWNNMGWLARGVVFVLFIMSIWSLAVMIDRYLYFNAARKQSREFAPRVAGALKEGKLDEAVKVADRNKKSHLAEVVVAGLQEFRNYGGGGAVSVEQIESSKRALERARGHRSRQTEERTGLAGHHRFHRPLRRPLRNRRRHPQGLPGNRHPKDPRYRRSRRRYL